MSLPHTYRFTLENKTGVTITSGHGFVTARRYKFDSNGALVYETNETTVMKTATDLTNNGFASGAFVDNTASLWVGGTFFATGRPNSGSAGNLNAYLDRSTDVGSNIDIQALGTLVVAVPFSSTNIQSRGRSFEL